MSQFVELYIFRGLGNVNGIPDQEKEGIWKPRKEKQSLDIIMAFVSKRVLNFIVLLVSKNVSGVVVVFMSLKCVF